MSMRFSLVALFAGVMLATSPLLAQPETQAPPSSEATPLAEAPPQEQKRLFVDQPGRGEKGGTYVEVRPSAEHNFQTGLHNGGDFSVTRGGVALKTEFWPERFLNFSLDASYEYSHYDFDNFLAETGVPAPLDDAQRITLRPGARMMFSRDWLVFAGGMIESAGDVDADFEDTLIGAGFLGARYRVNDEFAVRFGISAVSSIEEDLSFAPIISFKWTPQPDWTLELTGAQGGGILQLTHDLTEQWNLGIGAKFQSRDYRLAEDAAIPEGVFRDDRISLEAQATYSPTGYIDLTAAAGAVLFNQLTIENSNGNELREDGVDPTPFVGLRAKVRF